MMAHNTTPQQMMGPAPPNMGGPWRHPYPEDRYPSLPDLQGAPRQMFPQSQTGSA